MRNKTLILKRYPRGIPVAGKDIVIEDRPFDQNAPPPKGGLLVKVLWASYDPVMRGYMRMFKHKYQNDIYQLDGPILAWTIVNVVKSDARGFFPGDTITAYTPIAEFAYIDVKSNSSANTFQTDDSHPNPLEPGGPDGADRPPADLQAPYKINNPMNLELCYFLGPLGIAGLTAYYSLYKIGEPKAGETILVSSAAGAVGQVVGQLAKRLGLYVIGSAGTDEKVEFVTQELGFDAAFNYKKEKPGDALPRLAPNEIDIYYDNVGGEHLEAALNNMKIYGRIIGSGMMSEYNTVGPEIYPVRSLFQLILRRIKFEGFSILDKISGPAYWEEHQKNVRQWIADGSIKVKMDVTEGIDNAAEGLVGIFEGKNLGKAVLRI